ncbi:LptA/OstA family protein [Phenylobacterium sp.]|jgi:lipopolysaccharide export system protein LptA|uniref:LptA/OstA family protein n=1 Tax=Phenylobacterium sp. TaxID=1871053 RepID=UPI002E2EC483|nr:LptA/OstA family protein [Phenylobacterium sp.]HEX3365925.1 LptA/OstA family protein [Phenylobacterium sp.]
MKSLIAIAALAAALAAQPAAAQPAPAQAAAAQKPASSNSKAPVDITADQAEMHNNDCEYVYTGSAEALQETSRLRADVLIAHMEKKAKAKAASASDTTNSSCGDLISVEGKGHVYYMAGDGRRVHGDNAFYEATNKTVTVTGDVTAVDASNNVMRGTKMVYNTDTGEGHVEGGGKGPTAKNRPRGVFYPKDSDQNGAQAGDKAADQGQAGKTKKAAK